MGTTRWNHSATLLQNGSVLVLGGDDRTFLSLTTAEIFDPATGQWSPTASLVTPRFSFMSALLSNGQILVAGGLIGQSSELFNPALTPSSRPQISSVTGLWLGQGLALDGSGF